MERVNRKRKPAPRRHRRKPQRHEEPKRPPQRPFIVRRPERDWIVSPEEAIILKNAICKGATDNEFKFCLLTASRYRLDPFRKQIHFVRRWDRDADNSDGEKGGYIWVPIVGIDGLLHIAARDHKDFGTFSEPEYGPMKDLSGTANRGTPYAKPFKIKVPEWCRVEGKRKGATDPTVAKIWWDEIYPDVSFSPTVRKMPRMMIAKCTVAQVTRRSYPATGGLLIEEEILAKPEFHFTPEGRLLSAGSAEPAAAAEVVDPHLSHYEKREREGLDKLTQPQRQVVEDRMKNNAAAKPAEMIPMIFYKPMGGDRYLIDGDRNLMQQNRELLVPLWVQAEQSVIANTKQLGHLIREFEIKKVPFRMIERQPGE